MDAHPVIEEHKDQLVDAVGEIAWQALGLPAEERAGYIWLTLQRLRELYALQSGEMEPLEAEKLADRLQKWTEETVRMLEIGRDQDLWQSVWGSERSAR
jgi:hypothetical protein